MLYVAIRYVSIRPVVVRVKEEAAYLKFVTVSVIRGNIMTLCTQWSIIERRSTLCELLANLITNSV